MQVIWRKIPSWITSKKFSLGLYALLALAASIQSLLLGPKHYKETDWTYPSYNNYTIFKQSFFHLIRHQDLYISYPAEHWDLFKYTPTFSLLFAPLAYLPDAFGLTLWNLLNALVLACAVFRLPKMSERQKSIVLLAAAIEAMTSMQNEQSNALIAGLLIFAFVLCEKQKYFFAIGCILLASFIKPFGLAGFALFLFYPEKLKNLGKALLWFIILFALPLVAVQGKELILQYHAWLAVLAKDQAHEYGYSVAGWLHTWFHAEPNKNMLTGIGIALFMIPFLRIRLFSVFEFRFLALSSLLVWIVIFNHMAESPTFIIALAGAGIWYFSKENPTSVDTLLFLLAFAFASLSTTDIVPHHIRSEIFRPYVIKAVPMIWLWCKILLDMLRFGESAGKTSIPQPA